MKKKSVVRILGDAQETMDMLVELVPEASKREALRAAILVCADHYHIDLTPFLDVIPMDAEYNKIWRCGRR